MGCCGSTRMSTEKTNLYPITVRSPPFDKKSAITIIGLGPAGVHMACVLKSNGYENITILEKNPNDGHFGKTHSYVLEETGDSVIHEMGTCYLSWSYKHIRKLFEHYVGPDATMVPGKDKFNKIKMPAPKLMQTKGHTIETSDEWLYAHLEKLLLPPPVWNLVWDKAQALRFAKDVRVYRKLHEKIMGKYPYHGMIPQPVSKEAWKLIDQTYAKLMTSHGLQSILDLSAVGFGSYGYGYDVPALYGLWFVTPSAVESYIKAKLSSKVKPVEVVQKGYSNLWRKMIESPAHDIRSSIQYGAKVTSIDRNLDDESKKKVSITYEKEGKTVINEADFVIVAAPMQEIVPLIKKPTEVEKKASESIETVGLNVVLYKTKKKDDVSLTFYPETLQSIYTKSPDGEVYAERNSVRTYMPSHDEKHKCRYVVTYQHLPGGSHGKDEYYDKKAREFITSKEQVVWPTEGKVEKLYQKNWTNYFPRFNQKAIMDGYPWKVYQAEGHNKTWYIGSSVSFESVEDVTTFNLDLLKEQGFKIRFPPPKPEEN